MGGSIDLEDGIELLEQNNIDVKLVALDDPLKAAEQILDLIARVDLIVIGGGDGTLNAAAEALVRADVVMGIIPLGTANDLARTLGIPNSVTDACKVILEGKRHRIDIGKVNGKHFFNVASVGLSAQVVRYHRGERKRRWKVLSYLASVVDAFRSTRSFSAEVTCDGVKHVLRCIQIAVGNGRHYGGGMTVSDDATIDSEVLDLYILRPQSLWQLVTLAPLLRLGKHRISNQVLTLKGCEVDVRTRKPMSVNADGELVTQTPARFSVVPKCLTVMVPATHDASLLSGLQIVEDPGEVGPP